MIRRPDWVPLSETYDHQFVFILAALAVVLYVLGQGRARHVIHDPSRVELHPLSVSSLTRGIGVTIDLVFSENRRHPVVAIVTIAAAISTFLFYKWTDMQRNDVWLVATHLQEGIPWKRLCLHWTFFTTPTVPFGLNWILWYPLLLTALLLLLRHEVGGWQRFAEVLFVSYLMPMLVLPHWYQIGFPSHNRGHCGVDPMVFSLAAFLFLKNPKLYVEDADTRRVDIPVETRWFALMLSFALFAYTALDSSSSVVVGALTGGLLAVKDSDSADRLVQNLLDVCWCRVVVWDFVCGLAICTLPFTQSYPPLLLGSMKKTGSLPLTALLLESSSGASRIFAKLNVFLFVPFRWGTSRPQRAKLGAFLAALTLVNIINATNTPVWNTPALGWFFAMWLLLRCLLEWG